MNFEYIKFGMSIRLPSGGVSMKLVIESGVQGERSGSETSTEESLAGTWYLKIDDWIRSVRE